MTFGKNRHLLYWGAQLTIYTCASQYTLPDKVYCVSGYHFAGNTNTQQLTANSEKRPRRRKPEQKG